MAKTNKKDKDKEKPLGSSESAKSSNIPKPITPSGPAKGSHINPKVTPQVPKGAVPSQQPGLGATKANSSKANTHANSANNATNSNTKIPAKTVSNVSGNNTQAKLPTVASGNGGNSFHIPKGGDKRGRDPSLGSKSGQSIVPPPTKQPRTYASAAKGRDLHWAQDQRWPDLQLRVYKNTTYHEPISYDEFGAVREIMLRHSLSFLDENSDQGSLLKISSTYYNKLIHCGVYNFANIQALNWFKRELPTACNGAFRGWTKDEQVTTFVKIFMPNGFDSLHAQDYLRASRLMFRTQDTPDIPWGLINESIHPTHHTRQIIASIPTVTLQVIQSRGSETKEKSGVWKTDGFLAPFKVAVASASDLRSANNATSSPNTSELEQEEFPLPGETEMESYSPSASPSRSSTSSSSRLPLGPELTPSKFPELINDVNLGTAAASDAAEVQQENDDDNMDFRLLDEDAPGGSSWADEI
jgi:hypothetical protein